jgi:quinol monooxygenase YgiN
MPFVSITRLRLRSFWHLPRFVYHAVRSRKQAQKAPGNLRVDVLSDDNLAFWTKSLWKDEASMRAYMLSGAHRTAMPVLADMCDEAAVAHWEQEAEKLPSWQEAHQRMQKVGRPSKVRYPSAAQQEFKIPRPDAK